MTDSVRPSISPPLFLTRTIALSPYTLLLHHPLLTHFFGSHYIFQTVTLPGLYKISFPLGFMIGGLML